MLSEYNRRVFNKDFMNKKLFILDMYRFHYCNLIASASQAIHIKWLQIPFMPSKDLCLLDSWLFHFTSIVAEVLQNCLVSLTKNSYESEQRLMDASSPSVYKHRAQVLWILSRMQMQWVAQTNFWNQPGNIKAEFLVFSGKRSNTVVQLHRDPTRFLAICHPTLFQISGSISEANYEHLNLKT